MRLSIKLFFVCSILPIVGFANSADQLLDHDFFQKLHDLPTPRLDRYLAEHNLSLEDFQSSYDIAEMGHTFASRFFRYMTVDAGGRNIEERKQLIQLLSYATSYPQESVQQQIVYSMAHLSDHSINQEARDFLEESPVRGEPPSWLRLLGVANTPSSIPIAQSILGQNDFELPVGIPPYPWGAHLILARNGDEESIRHVIERITSRPNWLNSIAGAARDLMYLNQPEVVDIFLEMLFSDQESPHPAFPDLPIPDAYYGILYLNRIIADFPEGDFRSVSIMELSKDEIEAIRDWVRNHEGPWNIRDQRHTLRSEEWKLANIPGYGEGTDEDEEETIEPGPREESALESAPTEPSQPESNEDDIADTPSGPNALLWLLFGSLILIAGGAFLWSHRQT